MARVHSHAHGFDDRNALLVALLGGLSFCRSFADLLLELGPATTPPPVERARSDAFLDALVGMASLWTLAASALEQHAPAGDAAVKPAPPLSTSPPPASLRSLLA